MTPLRPYLIKQYADVNKGAPQDGTGPVYVDDFSEDNDSEAVFSRIQFQPEGDEHGTLHVTLAPLDDELRTWLEDQGASVDPALLMVAVPITSKSTSVLREWAKRTRRLAGKGKRYADRNWRWKCPRNGDALDHLATVLRQFRADRRHG